MNLALVVLGATVLAIVTRRRPEIAVLVALVVWVCYPDIAQRVIPWASNAPHPASLVIITAFLVQALAQAKTMSRVLTRPLVPMLLIGISLVAMFIATVAGAGSTSVLADQVLTPVMAMIIVRCAVETNADALKFLRTGVILLACAQASLALLQFALDSPIFYGDAYAHERWFDGMTATNRWMGTLAHPLTLSTLVCIAIPLVAGVSTFPRAFLALSLLSAGALVTQSRAGIVVAGIGVLMVVLRMRMPPLLRLLGASVVVCGAGLLLVSELAQQSVGRFQNSGDSNELRYEAYGYFLSNWERFLVSGDGFGSNYIVSQTAGLESSFESSFIMYAVDFGVVVASMYFVGMLALAFTGHTEPRQRGLVLAVLAGILLVQTYSALGTNSAIGLVLWVVVGLASSTTASLKHDSEMANEESSRQVRKYSSKAHRPVTRIGDSV